jgi:hypothetical protein
MITWRWAVAAGFVLVGCASPQPVPLAEPLATPAEPARVERAADAPVSEAPQVAGCPSEEPTELSTCTQRGLRCTYAERPECGAIWECYLGQWYARVRADCSPQLHGLCPPEVGKEPVGVSARSGLTCIYPEGVSCAYRAARVEQVCSGVPRAIPPPPPPKWRCEAPAPAACSLGRFQQGGACEPDGATCGASCCGLGAVCVQGEWQLELRPCPP